jgi:hypothetical protein
MIYILVNIFIFFLNVNDLKLGESYFKLENFTAFFWVWDCCFMVCLFWGNIFFEKLEDKKIKELMEEKK